MLKHRKTTISVKTFEYYTGMPVRYERILAAKQFDYRNMLCHVQVILFALRNVKNNLKLQSYKFIKRKGFIKKFYALGEHIIIYYRNWLKIIITQAAR